MQEAWKRSEENLPEIERNLNHRLFQCGHYLYHHAAGPRQRAVIQLLQENGAMNQRDIQEKLDIQPGSASELISKLESKGFLRRSRNEADKRKITITLTEQGSALDTTAPERTLVRRYCALNREEQLQLTALLERLYNSWEKGGAEQ